MISIIIKTNCSHKTYTIVLNICIRLIFRINSSIHSPPSAGSYLVLLYNSGQESIVANIISPCPSDCNFRRLPTLRSCPPEASNLPYLVYYYYSIYRGESVNVSADDAYTPMRRGIPARNLYRWRPYLAISIKMFNCSELNHLSLDHGFIILFHEIVSSDNALIH